MARSAANTPRSPCGGCFVFVFVFLNQRDGALCDVALRPLMDLPKLHPGKRYTLPRPVGSADALLLAHLCLREKSQHKITAIVTANAVDAQRLIDEMAFFAPDLRCVLFPDWETLPYDAFSPHQDLISERLATLWRISQREKETGADVVMVPATTALYRLAPPSFLAGYTFQFKVKQKLDEARLKAQLTLAGYSHVTQVVSPGEYAVRGGLIDLFPMGSWCRSGWICLTTRSTASAPLTPTASAACTRCPKCGCCRAASFPMDDDARAKFRSRWRELLEGDPTKSRIYKDIGNGVATAGIEYYLPLFFEETATVFDYLGSGRHGGAAWRPGARLSALLARHQGALPAGQGDPDRPALPPESLFLGIEQFYARVNQHAQLALRPALRTCRYTAPLSESLPALGVVRGAEDPLAALKTHIRNTHNACWCWPKAMVGAPACWTFCTPASSTRPRSTRWPSFRASQEPMGIATSSLNTGFSWLEAGIDFRHRDRAVCRRPHHPPAQEAGAGQRR